MEWPLQRRLSLAIDNDGSELAPTLEELLSIMLERAMSATRATGAAIALSEGRQMVCVAAQGTAPDVGTRFFSPNGEWIGFFADGKLKKMSIRGGYNRSGTNLGGRRSGGDTHKARRG